MQVSEMSEMDRCHRCQWSTQMIVMASKTSYSLNLMILRYLSDNRYVWQNLTGHRAVAIHYLKWNLTLYVQKVYFCQLEVFALANNDLWGHARIEILFPTPFPLRIPHSGHIITRNPTTACNIIYCNSIPLPASVFSSNPKYHGENKRNPASRQAYEDPLISQCNQQPSMIVYTQPIPAWSK